MILIVGFALVIGFAVSWIISIIGIFYTLPFLDYLQPDQRFTSILAGINLMFLVGLPIISIALFIARLLFGTRMNKPWSIALSAFWAANLISFVFIGTNMGRQFSAGSEVATSIDIEAVDTDTINLSLANNPYEHVLYFLGDEFQITEDNLISYNVELHIDPAEEGLKDFELIQETYSRGNSLQEANKLAQKVTTTVLVDESGITLPQNFLVEKGEKWRAQKLKLTLKVPIGKSIHFENPSVYDLIHHVHVDDPNDFKLWNNKEEIWTMGAEGLACSSCLPKDDENGLTYKDFSKLKIDGKMKVTIDRGDRFKVHLTGRKQHTENVDIIQMEETLLVSAGFKHTSSPVRLFITMPNLTALATENTDDIKITGFKEPRMSLSSKGRYEVKAYIDVDSLELTQKDRTSVDIRGNCNYLSANLINRSTLDAEKIAIKEVDIYAMDRSKAKLAVIDTVRQQSDKRSSITIDGNPSVIVQHQQEQQQQ